MTLALVINQYLIVLLLNYDAGGGNLLWAMVNPSILVINAKTYIIKFYIKIYCY